MPLLRPIEKSAPRQVRRPKGRQQLQAAQGAARGRLTPAVCRTRAENGRHFWGTIGACPSNSRVNPRSTNAAAAKRIHVSFVACIMPTAERGQNPCQPAATEIPPATGHRGEREEDQQRFLNIVAAIKDHRRGEGCQQPGGRARHPAQPRPVKAAAAGSGPGRTAPAPGDTATSLVWPKSPGPAHGRARERQPVQAGAVVIVGVVLVVAGLVNVRCVTAWLASSQCIGRRSSRGRRNAATAKARRIDQEPNGQHRDRETEAAPANSV